MFKKQNSEKDQLNEAKYLEEVDRAGERSAKMSDKERKILRN
jgi:hypothetical protein